MNATFTQQDDFNRRPLAEKISRLLQSDLDVSPMIIDGAWGTGKSIFCQKLINLMKETSPDAHHLVYIDAFRTDHTGEPLLALLAEIIKVCCPVNNDDIVAQEQRKNLINKFAAGAKFSIKTLFKAGLGHLLKQDIEQLSDELETVLDDTGKELGEKAIDTGVDKSIELVTATLLQEQIESEKNLQALQQTLKELASTKPIILFIDELDRCRPDYAIDMLEIIKHVFDIPEVKIVLVTNLAQLRAAVNHRYGDIVDSHKYLDKFIRLVYTLPKKSSPNDPSVSIQYFWDKMERSNNLKRAFLDCAYSDYYKMLINTILDNHTVSLRETETIIRNLEIYFYLQDGKNFSSTHKILVITTILLHCLKPSLLQDLLNWRADANELARFIKGGTDIKKFLPIDDNFVPTYNNVDLMMFYVLLSLCRVNIENYDKHPIDAISQKTRSQLCVDKFLRKENISNIFIDSITLLERKIEEILTVI